MDEVDRNRQLREIASGFVELPTPSLLSADAPPFDISKPNYHDTKAEFLQEVEYIDALIDHSSKLIDLMMAEHLEDAELKEVSTSVSSWIDWSAAKGFRLKKPEYTSELVRQSAISVGLSVSTLFLIFDLRQELIKRKQELEAQRGDYWSSAGRAPNHYARIIALRFAKLVASGTGKKPTFGTSSDGSHPSTEYGRALEAIFGLLEIDATVKHPAVWAIAQLTDEDLEPQKNALLGGLFGFGRQLQQPNNAMRDVVTALSKGNSS